MSLQMILVTRSAASVDVVRLSMVYYRIINTALCLKSLSKEVVIMETFPLLVVATVPTVWYLFTGFVVEKELRKRAHKLLVGFCINKAISYFISITVFTRVTKNLGNQGVLFEQQRTSAFGIENTELTLVSYSLRYVRCNSDIKQDHGDKCASCQCNFFLWLSTENH